MLNVFYFNFSSTSILAFVSVSFFVESESMANQFTNKWLLTFAIALFALMESRCVAQRFTSSKDAEAFERFFASGSEKKFYEPSTDLNDDEMHSPHMPEYLLCDACHILTYEFNRRFDFENEKRPSLNKKLPVTDILEAVEKVCSDGFTEIGVKEVDGVKRLSGPGSSAHYAGGMMHGGGLWPSRMKNMCSELIDEYEEMYKAYREDKLNMYLCDDPDTGYCDTVKREETNKKIGSQPENNIIFNGAINEIENIMFKEEGYTLENGKDKEGEEENGTEGEVPEEWIKKEEL